MEFFSPWRTIHIHIIVEKGIRIHKIITDTHKYFSKSISAHLWFCLPCDIKILRQQTVQLPTTLI